jgi:hypothetical protein
MLTFRKSLYIGLATLIAGWTGPTIAAPQKLFSVAMCVGHFANHLPASDPASRACATEQAQQLQTNTLKTPIEARVFNETPPTSNSTINSIDLFVDVNWRAIDGSVQTDNSGNWRADVTVDRHVRISNLAPIKPQSYVTVQFTVDNFSCGDGSWDAIAYTGSGFTGATFGAAKGYKPPIKTTVACGKFACGNFITDVQPQGDYTSDPLALNFIPKLQRGAFNEDGSTGSECSQLYAYVTPTTDKVLQTLWDKNADDSDVAVFSYTVNLEPTSANTEAAKLNEIEVAWLTTNGAPDLRPALRCDNSNPTWIRPRLPNQYTTLLADSGNKIQVAAPPALPGIPTTVPFPIVIEQERMIVTKINTTTNTWFVTRTAATPHTIVGTPVMSTPFPIVPAGIGYPTSYVGKPARVCIDALLQDPDDATVFKAIVIDGSDGWVRIGNF